jgi:hypothetical protein
MQPVTTREMLQGGSQRHAHYHYAMGIFYNVQGETRNTYSTYDVQYQDVGTRILQWMLKRSLMEVLGRTNGLRHGTYRRRCVQQFFYCCLFIRCRGNVFTEPLPSNDKGSQIWTHRMMGVVFSRLEIRGRHLPSQIAAPTKQCSPHHWKFSEVHTGPRFACGFQTSVCTRLYNKIVQATSRSRTESWEWTSSQHRTSWSQT